MKIRRISSQNVPYPAPNVAFRNRTEHSMRRGGGGGGGIEYGIRGYPIVSVGTLLYQWAQIGIRLD